MNMHECACAGMHTVVKSYQQWPPLDHIKVDMQNHDIDGSGNCECNCLGIRDYTYDRADLQRLQASEVQ